MGNNVGYLERDDSGDPFQACVLQDQWAQVFGVWCTGHFWNWIKEGQRPLLGNPATGEELVHNFNDFWGEELSESLADLAGETVNAGAKIWLE